MHVGLIGTGNIGSRFGNKLLDAGHALTVNDLRREVSAPLLARGAHWADTPAAVARATGLVIASLPNPAAVEHVAFDPVTGVLAGLPRDGVFVDMSTSPVALAKRIAQACAERGFHGLDAPVSNGGVYTTVGGDRSVFDRIRPLFDAISPGHVLYMGEAGQGQVTKLVRQYVSFINFFTVAEALVIAARAGGDVRAVLAFISESTAGTDFRSRSFDRLFAADFGSPGSVTATLDIVSKDVGLAVELAHDARAPASIGMPVVDVMHRAQAQGWGRHEYWAAVQVLEQMASTALRPPASGGTR